MKQKASKTRMGALWGTVAEYYDYSLYGFCPLLLANNFLPKADPAVAMITTYGVFAIGYIAKPLGSLIFGWIGDNFGRREALSITLLGIVIPTCTIGFLPTYNSIGFMASLTLVVCRFLQGIFVGGEYDGAALYIIEHASTERKSFSSALIRATGGLGLLLGGITVMICTSSRMPDWGWRIPFVLSLPLGVMSMLFRKDMIETPEFIAEYKIHRQARIPFVHIMKNSWKDIVAVMLLCGAFGGTYQITIIFLKSFLLVMLPEGDLIFNYMNPIIIVIFGFSMLISGKLADKIGTGIMIRRGIELAVVGAFMMVTAIIKKSIIMVVCGQIITAIGLAPFNSLSHALIYRLFAVSNRYRCVSVGHTLGSMLLSGTAPFICSILWRYSTISYAPVLYLISLMGLGWIFSCVCDRRLKAL